jgi:glycerophosphoryl diester phosphodiesterase
MAAFDKAIEEGADWIELDVQETAEGEVVVFHDRDFMKLAGIPLQIRHATRADLDRIDIGSWFDPSFADQRVPSLRDVLETARGRTPVLIELKFYGHAEELEARVVRIVEETGMAGEIAIMSLDHAAVAKVRAMRPDWRVGVLAARTLGNLASLDADFLAVEAGVVSTRLLHGAEAAGKQVYAWTVNDPMAMSRLISMAIDGLITDEPTLARKVLEQRAELGTLERLMLWFGEEIGRQLEPLPTQRELRP